MIAIYQGKSLVSKLIKFRTWSEDTHISWVEPDTMDEYEAWISQGVRKVKFGADHTDLTPVDLFHVDLTQGEHEGLLEFLDSQIGKGYDLRALLGFMCRLPIEDKNKLVCSEYIFAGFLKIKKPLLERIPAYKVPPAYFRLSPLLKTRGSTLTSVAGPFIPSMCLSGARA